MFSRADDYLSALIAIQGTLEIERCEAVFRLSAVWSCNRRAGRETPSGSSLLGPSHSITALAKITNRHPLPQGSMTKHRHILVA